MDLGVCECGKKWPDECTGRCPENKAAILADVLKDVHVKKAVKGRSIPKKDMEYDRARIELILDLPKHKELFEMFEKMKDES